MSRVSISTRTPQSDRMGRHAKIPAASWCQGHITTSWERSENSSVSLVLVEEFSAPPLREDGACLCSEAVESS